LREAAGRGLCANAVILPAKTKLYRLYKPASIG
jgi:hypothetical protein